MGDTEYCMFDTYSTSLEGMRRAEQRLYHAAQDIAAGLLRSCPPVRSTAPGATDLSSGQPTGLSGIVDIVDLSADMVAILEAETSFKANLKVAASQQELDRYILDLFG